MDLTKCIAENGSFIINEWFVQQYGRIPNSLTLTFNDEKKYIDLSTIDKSYIENLIGPTIFFRKCTSKYTSVGGAVEQYDVLYGDIMHTSDGGTCVVFATSEYLYSLDYNSIIIRYTEGNEQELQKHLETLWNKFPRKEEKPKEATANLVGYSDGSYYTLESKIKYVNANLEENYNDDFLPVYNDLTNFIDSRESGLVLLFGRAGSGKTTIIRHLISTHPHDYIVVPTSITSRLGDPDFVSFMIDNANSVFILEDCEQVLMDRSVNAFNGAISNILNMSDGLLSDIMNIKFICTFNADIKTIDQALLRKGRCYAKYEFKELTKDKVSALNEKYNLGISEIKPMTLAEIYNADKTEYGERKKTNKIGF